MPPWRVSRFIASAEVGDVSQDFVEITTGLTPRAQVLQPLRLITASPVIPIGVPPLVVRSVQHTVGRSASQTVITARPASAVAGNRTAEERRNNEPLLRCYSAVATSTGRADHRAAPWAAGGPGGARISSARPAGCRVSSPRLARGPARRALTRWCVARGEGAARCAGRRCGPGGAARHAASPGRAAPDRRPAGRRPRAVPAR